MMHDNPAFSEAVFLNPHDNRRVRMSMPLDVHRKLGEANVVQVIDHLKLLVRKC